MEEAKPAKPPINLDLPLPPKSQPRRAAGKKPAEKVPKPPTLSQLLSRNPGRFEDLNKESRNICDNRENFDGFRADYSRPVTNAFSVAHLLSFGSVLEEPNYGFTATYIHKGTEQGKPLTKDKTTPSRLSHSTLLHGRWQPGKGVVQGRVQLSLDHTPPKGSWTAFKSVSRAVAVASGKPGHNQLSLEMDLKLKDCTAQFRWHSGGIYELAYVQKLYTSKRFNLSAGMMGFHHKGEGKTELSGGTRVEWKEPTHNNVVTATYATYGQLTTSYSWVHNSKRKIWTTEMTFLKPEGHEKWAAVWGAGYSYQFITSSLRAKVDSTWKCSCIVNEMLNPIISMQFCGDMDYQQDKYRIGVGASVHL